MANVSFQRQLYSRLPPSVARSARVSDQTSFTSVSFLPSLFADVIPQGFLSEDSFSPLFLFPSFIFSLQFSCIRLIYKLIVRCPCSSFDFCLVHLVCDFNVIFSLRLYFFYSTTSRKLILLNVMILMPLNILLYSFTFISKFEDR